MVKEELRHALLCLVVLLVSCGALLAAGPDRIPNVAVAAGSPVIHPLDTADTAGLATIFSNLGSKTDTYDDKFGWVIAGPESALGEEQWIAASFVPKATATFTRIKIPVGWDGPGYGANGFTLAVFTNSGGVPGELLHKWAVMNLFMWGTCCDLDVANDKKGIQLEKGKRYWVVAETGTTTTQTMDAWAYTWNHHMGTIAYDLGKGWIRYPNQVIPAFALYGTKP
jgi:hypothetical protein